MRFNINLATRTYVDKRLMNQVSAVVIIILFMFLFWNITRISLNLSEQRRLASEIKALEDGLNARPGGISEKDFTKQQARVSYFNEIIDIKGRNWLKLLEMLENITPEGVALSAVTPGEKEGELKLDGRARSFAVVRQYVEKLEESKTFSDVLLRSHQELTVGENGRGVQFSISCKVQF